MEEELLEPAALVEGAHANESFHLVCPGQKLVRNHPRIVNMIEASVSELPGGTGGSKGYEIFILMEWCAGAFSRLVVKREGSC